MFRPSVRSRWVMALVAIAWVAALAGSSGYTALADPPHRSAELPVDRGIDQRVADFTLTDAASSRPISLYSFVGKKAIALVFLGTDCPVGNLYIPRLIELNQAYRSRGVVFLGINSNAHESGADVARLVRETGIDFPVLKDVRNQVSDSVLVERTCEVLLLDGFARIRYRGAIDDQYAPGQGKGKPQQTYLRDALDALLAGRPVAVKATRVAGCLLDRLDPPVADLSRAPRIRAPLAATRAAWPSREPGPAAKVGSGAVTYSHDVARVIQDKCQSCHRPGQVGPFSLLTYDDARKHAAMIREVVDQRRMPPWHADPNHGPFQNDRSLSTTERASLLAWIDQGAPLGDPQELPPPRRFPEGWSIGQPDIVFELPETYHVPAQGVVAYAYFRVPTNFQEDRWIQAAEARPGDPSVVHHIVVFIRDPNDRSPRRGPGDFFCGYAPGDLPTILPEGTAKKIPAGSELIFQMHYTPNGRIRTDRSKVGFILARSKPTRQAYTIGIANPDLLIPPGRDNVAVSSSLVVPRDVRLVSFMPHMHLRGKDFQYTITRPGESPRVVLSVPSYDFGWQSYYILAQPMALPKGTRIDCLAHFDNSTSNPYNPDPTKLVRWGEQTFEEMMIGYVDLDVPAGSPPLAGSELRPASIRASQAVLQAVRRLTHGGAPGANPNPAAKPSVNPTPSRPSAH